MGQDVGGRPWVGLAWPVGEATGWGQFGLGFGRSVWAMGGTVWALNGVQTDAHWLLPADRVMLREWVPPSVDLPDGDTPPLPAGAGWVVFALGNGIGVPSGRPTIATDRTDIKRAGLVVIEDVSCLTPEAVEYLKGLDARIAPSQWVADALAAVGIPDVPVAVQGYDERVWLPRNAAQHAAPKAPRVAGGTPPRQRGPFIFSGGKLEFRKGQDIVVAAFRTLLTTLPNAVLVTAWDNPWPQTMDGIWLAGHVKGVPAIRGGKADVTSWLVANGIPARNVRDVGKVNPLELAAIVRSCDVGVFPNRCEGATNMVLVEALASGVPCVATVGHGQGMLTDAVWPIASRGQVPRGCRLFGTQDLTADGWTEADPTDVAQAIIDALDATGKHTVRHTVSEDWTWHALGTHMYDAILAQSPITPTTDATECST
jgi:glycosyltransferase involved in cell wall biosynthesis